MHQGALDGSAEFADIHRLWKRLRRLNEPLTFGIYPDSLKAYLASCGLDLLESLGASGYRERCMGPSAHQIKGYEFYESLMRSAGQPHNIFTGDPLSYARTMMFLTL
jgi:hypothetical protein